MTPMLEFLWATFFSPRLEMPLPPPPLEAPASGPVIPRGVPRLDPAQKIPEQFRTLLRKKSVPKSEAVIQLSEFAEARLPEAFQWPSEVSVRVYADIPAGAAHDLPARKLRSLGVLPEEKRFGTLSDADPDLHRDAVSRLANKTFEAIDFRPHSLDDPDRDGVLTETDFCPRVPGEDEGCPAVALPEKVEQPGVTLTIEDPQKFDFLEQQMIRVGDLFRAVIADPENGEIFSTSESITVTH